MKKKKEKEKKEKKPNRNKLGLLIMIHACLKDIGKKTRFLGSKVTLHQLMSMSTVEYFFFVYARNY